MQGKKISIIYYMNEANSNFIEELKSKITVNDLLQVRIEDDPNSATYNSRVNDFSEGRLVIAWPTNSGMRLLLHDDQLLDFSFIKDGTPYVFTGLVDEDRVEPLPELTIILSSSINPVQRRQDFRVKCLIPIEVAGTYKEDSSSDKAVPLNTKTVSNDLSASGISIRLPSRIPEGTLISIKISLPDDGLPISIPCTVVYSDYQTENQVLFRTGIRYLAISASERARIVRYLYRAQLQGLRA
jgi:c-di-GMP-binding flagellar brake protein YcgR